MPLSQLHRWLSAATRALGARVAAAPLAVWPEGLRVGGRAVHKKALLLAFAFAATNAHAALPPNTPITNTATASFNLSGVAITTTGSATVVTTASTPAHVALLGYESAADAGAGAATLQTLPVTQCSKGGSFVNLPPPVVPGRGALPVPSRQTLAPTTLYASGDVLFVQVTDLDQNVDPLVADTVTVTVATSKGDSELLRLTETGPSTGVFVGYLQTSAIAGAAGNCLLNVTSNERITVTYLDRSESSIAVSAGALIDPLGVVFDSSTGQPVNGASVTLVNVATGQPASVLGNDGVSSFPSTIVTGSTVQDTGGTSYSFGAGQYQFPRLAPGDYKLQIVPPTGFRFPSTAPAQTLLALPGGPFQVGNGSHGEAFALVPGPALQIDVPVDPGPLGDVSIVKTSGKAQAAIGDFVPYMLVVTNTGSEAIPGVLIADRLPVGFRFQKGSARLDDKAVTDPQVGADGRSLQFAIGNLAGGSTATLRYVALIAAGAQPGLAENTAHAAGRVTSNTAKAVVTVREDLNQSRAILAGRVTVSESCEADQREPGAARALAGVRMLLQDGTTILTDAEGNWHADNLRAGTHVVQIDTTTLPQGMELQSCVSNTRTGGRDFSQFVNVRGGTLWRADFRLARKPSCLDESLQRGDGRMELRLAGRIAAESVTATLLLPAGARVDRASLRLDGHPFEAAQVEQAFIVLRLPAQHAHWQHVLSFAMQGAADADAKVAVRLQAAGQPAAVSLAPMVLPAGQSQQRQCVPVPAPAPAAAGAAKAATAPAAAASSGRVDTDTLVEKLPYDDKWLAGAAPGNEWLHPQASFNPALPVVKVAIKHARGSRVELTVNGKPVDPLRFEGSVLSPDGAWQLSNWRSVDLANGPNVMHVVVRDATGKAVLDEQRTIHFSVSPARAEFDPEHSRLVADGRSAPVVAVRMLDRLGKPVRKGVTGEFSIDAPFASQQFADALQRDPLSGNVGGKPHFQIGDDGIALIPLQPTTQSGEAVLHFDFGDNHTQDVRAWLTADLREWVLVGFAEGTLGHRKLSGSMEALANAGASDQLFDRDRLAFYAKGQIKGEYLLTAAYDSAKEHAAPQTAQSTALKQIINPSQYYTLYGDATQAQADAASTGRLYLKIEKKQFYALFGDYDTGLTVTELGRYSRTLTGLKSEYKGERFGYNAFAARTSQSFVKDELQGDGTSGLYRLRAKNILVNSEKVRLETRDRFQPDTVLNTRSLTPFLDYTIDYAQGTLMFREPVMARDETFNPVFIVAEYESDDAAGATWTYGGRASARVGDKTEVGVTAIHEGTTGREATLTAADATVRVDETTRLRAEVAASHRNTDTGPQSGSAYLLEARHDDGHLAARAYASEQQPNFGLGQQSAAAQGRRKLGAEARVKVSEQVEVQGQAYREEDLATGGKRELAEARADWKNGKGVSLSGGARVASEQGATTGADSHVAQVTGGVGYEMLDKRLLLRASTELDVAGGQGTTNYPNRVLLGADYRLTPETTLVAQHEIARGSAVSANTTRIGLRTKLWTGAEAQLGVGGQGTTDASRLYSTMGLVQRVKINDHWSADAGIDRVQTLHSTANPLGPNQPLASGTTSTSSSGIVSEDYTAVSAGLAYRDDAWSGNARAEWRGARTDTKVNLLLGAQRRLGQGRIAAIGLSLFDAHGTTEARNATARLSYALRPDDSDWMLLERLEYVEDANRSLASRLFTRKLIQNFNANWNSRHGTQVAIQYGAKYVRETLGDAPYHGFTDLIGLEVRHDLSEKWDLGLHAGMLHSWNGGGRSYQLGLSVGYRMAPNTWVTVGYNQVGFKDPDFAGADYRAKGLYVNMRMKFDQDTFDLNDRSGAMPSPKP